MEPRVSPLTTVWVVGPSIPEDAVVGAVGVAGLDAASAVPVTANCSDASVTFSSGRTFAELEGQDVVLESVVEDAMVYTVGFAAA